MNTSTCSVEHQFEFANYRIRSFTESLRISVRLILKIVYESVPVDAYCVKVLQRPCSKQHMEKVCLDEP